MTTVQHCLTLATVLYSRGRSVAQHRHRIGRLQKRCTDVKLRLALLSKLRR